MRNITEKIEAIKEAGIIAESGQNKMWDGRFTSKMSESMANVSFSLDVDEELLREDIQCSLAHGKGLVEAKILTALEYTQIARGLQSILSDVEEGKILWNNEDEDVHMAVERVLTERIGELGKRIHTGRSRNDQVVTDFKLYIRNKAMDILDLLSRTQTSVLEIAEEHLGKIMPGYTHLQQAQPILFSHYLMSLFFALQRDRQRLSSFLDIHNQCPLGSGALAGSAFNYNRKNVARELGFSTPSANSIDAVSHRDFALEFLNDLAIIGSTLSRYAEDFVIWSSAEFGYLTLHDSYSSGSSMMPQKKNPDCMELIRGKAGRLIGNYTALFTTVKGAPLTYSRDLQEDKEPVFDSVKTVCNCLIVFEEALKTATWNFSAMENKMLSELLATDFADALVKKGFSFRDAHHIVGNSVAQAAKQKIKWADLPDEFWNPVPGALDIRKKLSFANAIENRDIEGGTSEQSLKEQFKKAKDYLSGTC